MREMVIDVFAGGGGASLGIERAGMAKEICPIREKGMHVLLDELCAEGSPNNVVGWIYFFSTLGEGRFIKIGMARDVGRRMKEVQCSNPDPLVVVWKYGTHDCRREEAYWHGVFDRFRRKGEWFSYRGALRTIVTLAAKDEGVARFLRIWAALEETNRRIIRADLFRYELEYQWLKWVVCSPPDTRSAVLMAMLSIDETVRRVKNAEDSPSET